MTDVHENGCYSLSELDGTLIKTKIAGKRIKVFKRRNTDLTLEEVAHELCLIEDPKARGSQAEKEEDVGKFSTNAPTIRERPKMVGQDSRKSV